MFGWVKKFWNRNRSGNTVPPDRALLILLRTKPFSVNEEQAEQAAQDAWIQKFGDHDGPFWFSGTPGRGFVFQPYGNALMVLCTARGERVIDWPTDLDSDPSRSIRDRFEYDVSVSPAYRYWEDESQMESLVARLCAEFVDEETLAVFHPASGRIFLKNQDLARQLREKPELFFHGPLN